MLILLTCITLCSEPFLASNNLEIEAKQQTLMKLVIDQVSFLLRKHITRDRLNSNPCDTPERIGWYGVECSNGIVTAFRVENFHEGNFSYAFLPQSLETLVLSSCSQMQNLEVRLLPRSLRTLDLHSNHFWGPLEVPCFPRSLESCNLAMNKLSGAVHFLDLPSSLVELDLSANHFRQKVIYYGIMPRNLAFIDMRMHTINKVSMRALYPADKRADIRSIIACD